LRALRLNSLEIALHHCCQKSTSSRYYRLTRLQKALWTRQAEWQTSRRANLARWPFVSFERYSRQPISCFLRWQSSHRRRYSGRLANMAATRKTEKHSTLSSAYRFDRTYSSRKSWLLQFHNSELYFRTRPPNLCSHRCERDFIVGLPPCFCTTADLPDL